MTNHESGLGSPSALGIDTALLSLAQAIEEQGFQVADTARVRNRVHVLCREAKRTDTPVEVLIIGLRRTIDQRNSLNFIEKCRRERIQQALVSFLIATYFR